MNHKERRVGRDRWSADHVVAEDTSDLRVGNNDSACDLHGWPTITPALGGSFSPVRQDLRNQDSRCKAARQFAAVTTHRTPTAHVPVVCRPATAGYRRAKRAIVVRLGSAAAAPTAPGKNRVTTQPVSAWQGTSNELLAHGIGVAGDRRRCRRMLDACSGRASGPRA